MNKTPKPIITSQTAKTSPKAIKAAAIATGSGHQDPGLKKPKSGSASAISASSKSSGPGPILRRVNRI